MTRDEFLNNHWRFYLMLEKRFINAINYVELSEDNYFTYSVEFVSELREIGSEIDIIMKELTGSSPNERSNIAKYAQQILTSYPKMLIQKISSNASLILEPFKNWDMEKAAQSLEWWEAYNNVKHGRVDNFKQANLKNVFFALGALFILENYLLKKISDPNSEPDVPDKESNLFTMLNWTVEWRSLSDFYF